MQDSLSNEKPDTKDKLENWTVVGRKMDDMEDGSADDVDDDVM